MSKITPFLWFDGQVEEAINFYTSVFKNAKVHSINRAGPNGPVFSATFELEGQEFYALNGGPMYKFNEAISFFISCKTQDEVDYYWNELTADGGEESRCGWLKDKFGLSWQVIPDRLGELLQHKDPAKAQKAMNAMMAMGKIIISDLEKAVED